MPFTGMWLQRVITLYLAIWGAAYAVAVGDMLISTIAGFVSGFCIALFVRTFNERR